MHVHPGAEAKAHPTAGFRLTAADIQILCLVFEYRFLRRDHLCTLTGRSPRRLHRRLLKLIRRNFLTPITLPQQKHIYALGRASGSILVEQGIVAENPYSQRHRTHELKELFLKHEMMIVDVHVALTVAARKDGSQVVAWREGSGLHDSVTVAGHNGIEPLPIRPDAFFTLGDPRRPQGANHVHFFLEADRSTATQTRFRNKILAYWHYLEQGLHSKKFGIRTFRVLTVTLTEERAENLCRLAASILPPGARKYFLFTSIRNFALSDPASLIADVCLSPRDLDSGARYPLLPNIQGLAEGKGSA